MGTDVNVKWISGGSLKKRKSDDSDNNQDTPGTSETHIESD